MLYCNYSLKFDFATCSAACGKIGPLLISSFTCPPTGEVNEKISEGPFLLASVWRLRIKSDKKVCGFLPCQVPGFQGSSFPGLPKQLPNLLYKYKGGKGVFLEARRNSGSNFLILYFFFNFLILNSCSPNSNENKKND
jgi:hypothetical protein